MDQSKKQGIQSNFFLVEHGINKMQLRCLKILKDQLLASERRQLRLFFGFSPTADLLFS